MNRLITGTQAKEADRYAIDVLGIPSLELMYNASKAAAEHIYGKHGSGAVYISVCGSGNNGADGVCMARILKEHGCDAFCLFAGNPDRKTEEFVYQEQRAIEAGVVMETLDSEADFKNIIDGIIASGSIAKAKNKTVIIDALFGIGLHRAVSGRLAEIIDGINALKAPKAREAYVYAVDIPSGIDSDSGKCMGRAVRADETLTFGCVKTGLVMQDAGEYTGRIAVFDIGIPEAAYKASERILTTLCYIEQDGSYLMLYRNKKKNDINEGKWIGVGGKLEQGENPDECVIREALEETGLRLIDPELRGVIDFFSDKGVNEVMFLYTAEHFTGDVTDDCSEGELKWIPVSELGGIALWEGDRIFLKELAEGRRNIRLRLEYEGNELVRVNGRDI